MRFGLCERPCCKGHRSDETLEHLVHDCPYVARFWRLALEAWNSHTGECLDFRDARTTMLGDRLGGYRECTEEPWRVLHAVAIDVLLKSARAAKHGRRASARRQC